MGFFVCGKCGLLKEARCKPKKCPECGANGSMAKKEEPKK